MAIHKLAPVVTTLEPSNHPQLKGVWTLLHEDADSDGLIFIPTGIDSVCLGDTENAVRRIALPRQILTG